MTDDELWQKCLNDEPVTAYSLGINNQACGIIVECGEKTFYWDGEHYYDGNGNLATQEDIEKYKLI